MLLQVYISRCLSIRMVNTGITDKMQIRFLLGLLSAELVITKITMV